MANIPVERTSGGTPWWVWLLALLAVAGLLWLIAELFEGEPDADDVAATDDVGVVEPAEPYAEEPAAAGTITSLSEIWQAREQGNLYGREVRLTDVRATNVVGDSTFFIRDEDSAVDPEGDAAARLLVVLESLGESEVYAPGPEGSDGRYNVDEGDIVDIEGRVDRFTGTERQVTGQNRDRLAPDSLYINAQRVTSDEDTVRSQQ